MLAIQGLKKQLRGIRTTQKLTKAMRTVSTVKFSKLNEIYNQYSKYGKQCRSVFEKYGRFFKDSVLMSDPEAPELLVVMSSNKGLCGNFNAEILRYAEEKLEELKTPLLVTCGRYAADYFHGKKRALEKEYVLNDIPTYEESSALLQDLVAWRQEGKISRVYLVYPQYINMMNQVPTVVQLFHAEKSKSEDAMLFVPDRETVSLRIAQTVFREMFYEYVLETAIGAQAATLLTMRSAFDTATEYYQELEGKINRMRQSAVTADVIETSAEWKEE